MNEANRKTRIVLVDDRRMVRDGLRASFGRCADMEIIGESDADPQALPPMDALPADVIIVGVGRDSGNPRAILEHVMRGWPQACAIALAAGLNRVQLGEFFRAGVHGYVTIQCGFEELREAVRTVMSGSTYVCSQATRTLLDDCTWGGSSREGSPDALLTDREATILQLLAEGRTSKEIAAFLGLSSKTIDACRRQLMRKLKVDSVAGLVKYALLREMTTVAPLPAQ